MTTDPLDALVAEAMNGWLHDAQANSPSVPLRISAVARAVRAALLADRKRQAERLAALTAAGEALCVALYAAVTPREPYSPTETHVALMRWHAALAADRTNGDDA